MRSPRRGARDDPPSLCNGSPPPHAGALRETRSVEVIAEGLDHGIDLMNVPSDAADSAMADRDDREERAFIMGRYLRSPTQVRSRRMPPAHQPRRQIPQGRRAIVYVGRVLMAIGGLVFLSSFCLVPVEITNGPLF